MNNSPLDTQERVMSEAVTFDLEGCDGESGRCRAEMAPTLGGDWIKAEDYKTLLLKLRTREKQLEIEKEYATSRLCVAHRGHWERGRCVVCDLELAQSRLDSAPPLRSKL